MIMWNFDTPITFLASCLWNFCEKFKIQIGNFTPHLFSAVIGNKKYKKK